MLPLWLEAVGKATVNRRFSKCEIRLNNGEKLNRVNSEAVEFVASFLSLRYKIGVVSHFSEKTRGLWSGLSGQALVQNNKAEISGQC